jgi:hypothetical protein
VSNQKKHFFTLNRNIFEHELFFNETYSKREAWIYLICSARWKSVPLIKIWGGKEVEIKRGQTFKSENTLMKEWRWSKNKVRRFLKTLEKNKMISQETITQKKIITIVNYDKFQLDYKGDEYNKSNNKGNNDEYEKGNRKNKVNKENKENKIKTIQKKFKEVLDYFNFLLQDYKIEIPKTGDLGNSKSTRYNNFKKFCNNNTDEQMREYFEKWVFYVKYKNTWYVDNNKFSFWQLLQKNYKEKFDNEINDLIEQYKEA